jgi:3-phytase
MHREPCAKDAVMTLTRLMLIVLLTTTTPIWAQTVADVATALETPQLTEADADADADDPAFWISPMDAADTLVITAVKNGGMRVYDLKGALVQAIAAEPETDVGAGRINNVDVVYGMTMTNGSQIDVAIASDRGLDVLRVFRVDAAGLTEITDLSVGRAFPTKPDVAGGADLDNSLDDQMSIYGIAGWKDGAGQVYAVATQRTNPRLGIFTLTPTPDGKVAVAMVRDVRVPFTFMGQDLTVESEDNPLMDWNPQFEGVTVDHTTGTIYAGQEDVGIWRIDAATGVVEAAPVVTTRGAATSLFTMPDSPITRDVEGLTIFYGATKRYLLASSQGGAHGDARAPDAPFDDSFVVFDITSGFDYLGSFRLAATDTRDAVQESDGADVMPMALPGFPNGLMVMQDGYDDDLNGMDGEVSASNFKYVDWAVVAGSFIPPLEVNPAFNPRK